MPCFLHMPAKLSTITTNVALYLFLMVSLWTRLWHIQITIPNGYPIREFNTLLQLEVDSFGNVLKSATIGYGRRTDPPYPSLLQEDHEKQRLIHITCTENTFTNPVVDKSDAYRTPLPTEACTYELRKPEQEKSVRNELTSYINSMPC